VTAASPRCRILNLEGKETHKSITGSYYIYIEKKVEGEGVTAVRSCPNLKAKIFKIRESYFSKRRREIATGTIRRKRVEDVESEN